jgi:hypothetical protein
MDALTTGGLAPYRYTNADWGSGTAQADLGVAARRKPSGGELGQSALASGVRDRSFFGRWEVWRLQQRLQAINAKRLFEGRC